MIDVALARRVGDFRLDVAFANGSGITALFGRSGSGKSMTLGLIAGLARPDRGRVTLDGTVLLDTSARVNVPVHRRRIGLVFQDAQLFPHLSVRQNLRFGRWFAPRDARHVDFDAVVETLGLASLLARRPSRLSGGERQRVAIGRALLAAPRLLLFDEPLASLDRARKLEILPLVERLRDEFAIPIVYVSHAQEEVVRLATKVVVIDKGRVVAQGGPADVLRGLAQEEPRFGRVSVVEATVGPTDPTYGLTALRHPSGTLWVAGPAGPIGRKVRTLVRATDVSLAPGDVGPISIRSQLAGTVREIATEGPLAATEIALDGGGALTALVTRQAIDALDLSVGSRVRALVKSVALDEASIAHGAGSG